VFIDTSKNGINPSKPLVSPTEVSPLSTNNSNNKQQTVKHL